MAKAYFLINVAEKFGRQEVMRDLQAMPEVKSVEAVRDVDDLLVRVEAPIGVILVANKIMAKEWVKRLHVVVEDEDDGRIIHLRVTSVSQNQTGSPPLLR